MPILSAMESFAAPFPEPEPIDLPRLARACEGAASAAAQAATPALAIDAALDILHDELGEACVVAFVLEHGLLWSVGVRGNAMIPDGLPLDEGVIGRAVRESAPQLALDVTSDPDFIEVLRGVTSELAIPLMSSAGVVGVINIETTSRLPVGGEAVVDSLARFLAGPIEELRDARTIDLSSLARLFVYMSSLRDPRAIADVAVRSLGRVLPVETSQLLLLDESGQLGESAEWRAAAGGPEPMPRRALEALREHIGQSAVFDLLDPSTIRVPELVGTRFRCAVLIPLRANGEEIGLLVGTTRFAIEFDRGQGEIASLLAAHAAASLDAALALGRERRSAHTDTLTGLLNRRGLEERLDRELDSAQDDRRPVSLVVLDCDDFKDVNDRAGHELGDALLREIGLVLQRVCPDTGSAARLGGDEFVVMLPGTDADAAVEVADQLRRELDDGLDDAGFPLRLSAGLSTYPYDGGGASQLLRAADQALYQAKANGKNHVVSFRDVVRGTKADAAAPVGIERGRGGSGVDGSVLVDTMDAAAAIWAEDSVDGVLERLSKSVTFVVGATGALISRVEGARLVDAVRHSMRDIDLGEDTAYLISDFPVTQEVLEKISVRSISFLDDDLDRAEAFVLRELRMNCALLLPLVVHGRSWGLVEVYDMRLRRYSREDEAVAWFLVGQAGRRIGSLGEVSGSKRRLPLFRLPSA
jgi:diguanylate cyclase (GGDEF)-like protein